MMVKKLLQLPSYMFGGTSLSHIILWATLGFFVMGGTWAYLAVLDEVTSAQGTVIPSQQIQKIQNLEGGIVKSIKIREGQTVQKGQVLMVLGDTRFRSEYREATSRRHSLLVKISRLRASINGKPFEVTPELQRAVPDLVESERYLYVSTTIEMKNLLERRRLVHKEMKMNEPLVKEGAVSEVEVLRLKQSVGEIDGAVANFRSTALNELNTAKAELSRIDENISALKDRLQRTVIRSPVHGIVKQLFVNTIGGVIQPGMDIVEVVPLDDTLLIEARVKPADIGFLHPGQKAKVKITAYDFSIYGGLDATVEHISADTTRDDQGETYYEVWVRTDKNFLGTDQKPLQIIPGMTATVDVLTGHKSVFDYIMKPILKAKQKALRER